MAITPVSLTVAEAMQKYSKAGAEISRLKAEQATAREAIMSFLRQTGENVESIEAGGFRASVHYREYVGFNDTNDDGSPVSDDTLFERLKDLRDFMANHAPTQDIPSSERLQKAVDGYIAVFGEQATVPTFLRKSNTPVLRVSGKGIVTQ